MRRVSFSRSIFGGALFFVAAYACAGRGFKGGNGDEGGQSEPDGGETLTGGTGGNAGSTNTGGNGKGGTATGGASPTGGSATSGGASSGGSQGGAGKSSGGTAGTAAGGLAGSGGAIGGRGTVAGMSGGGTNASGSGGSGGSSSGVCANEPLCELCCDELYPGEHGRFAGQFLSCGCGQPCYAVCGIEFCGTAYDWSNDCLRCMADSSDSSAECTAAARACDDNEVCNAYRACALSCD